MQHPIDTVAHQTEHGIQAQCPTTGETYIALTARISGAGAWLLCGCCDALLHTHDDCDPTAPQWHLYEWQPGERHV